MNHEFCMECGHKNLFEASKPKFCAGCGRPLNTFIASKATRSSFNKQEEDEERNENFGIESLDIEKLRKQIGIESFARKVSLDELWSSPAPADNHRRPAVSSPMGEDLLKSIKNDCAPTRRAKDIDE